MPLLPSKASVTGINITQGTLRSSLDQLLDYLSEALGADSAAPGLRAISLNGASLGFRNWLGNGDFRLWRRGTNFSSVNGATTDIADRWRINGPNPGTLTAQRLALSASDRPQGWLTYALRLTQGAAGATPNLFQRIEDPEYFEAAKVSLSFWARAPEGGTLTLLVQNVGGTPTVYLPSLVLTGSWQRYEATVDFSLGGNGPGTGMTVSLRPPTDRAYTLDLAGIQLEAGSRATWPERRPLGLELLLAERYYQTLTVWTRSGNLWIPWRQSMRAAPTVTTTLGSVSQITASGCVLTHSTETSATLTASAEP